MVEGLLVTDKQLFLVIAIPILMNSAALVIFNMRVSRLVADLRHELDDLRSEMNLRFKVFLERISELDARVTRLEQRQ